MNNTSKVFKEEINVSDSNKFLTVKEAAVELQFKVGQIKHLISQELIDSKLENGTRLVDVNSIDELVMIDLKKRENVYPRRQDYKLKSNKTIDKKIVINSIIRYVNNFVGEEAEKSRKDFGKLFGIDTANKDIPNVQILVHDMIHNHHDKNIILVNRCDKYTISYFNNKSENLFYFFDTKEFKNSYNLIQTATYLECNSGNFSDKDAEHLFNEKLSKYFYENHIFCLTLDEFIKEFSPPQYYEKNKLWSMYLDKKEYVAEEASNDEEIKRSPMELHKVNGYWRNQPYGSRKNPRYEKIWVDDFARGGKKVKMAA